MFDEMKAYVASKGLPPEDGHGLPRSTRTFPDGAHFATRGAVQAAVPANDPEAAGQSVHDQRAIG